MTPQRQYSATRKLIEHAGADPEKRLAAVLIADAKRGCLEGDTDDCRWLRSCSLAYLQLVTPYDVDPAQLVPRLLEDLPDASSEPVTTWQEGAGRFVQLMLGIFQKGVERWQSD